MTPINDFFDSRVCAHGATGKISGEHMTAAARIAVWHVYEARHILGEMALPKGLSNAARLDDWLTRYCKEQHTPSISTRHIQRTGPNCIRDGRDLDQALTELADAGRVKRRQDGRQKRVYVSPRLLGVDHGAT